MSYTIKNSNKVKVNDPCPCGSTAKYKNCCRDFDVTAKKEAREAKEKAQMEADIQRRIHNLTGIDAHFWVVRDGEVKDFHFNWYNEVCRQNKCDITRQCYYPAPQHIQDIYIANLTRKHITGKTAEDYKDYRPQANECVKNTAVEYLRNGGTIVFGSMGWKKIDSEEIHWEYGGKDYDTADKFINATGGCSIM
jgi:hypothetical protein